MMPSTVAKDELYSQVLDLMSTPVCVVAADGSLAWRNRAFAVLDPDNGVSHISLLLEESDAWTSVRQRLLRFRQTTFFDVKLGKNFSNYVLVTNRSANNSGLIVAELKPNGHVVSTLKATTRELIQEESKKMIARKLSSYRKQARVDYLTGIYNRKFLDEELLDRCELARANRTHLSLMLIDIDRFKDINDAHGHGAGDLVIKKVAWSIRSFTKRREDFAARYGGDEFALILYATDIFGAMQVGRKLLAGVNKLKFPEISGFDRNVSISIGCVTMLQREDIEGKSMLEKADTALLNAKSAGRNQLKFFKQES